MSAVMSPDRAPRVRQLNIYMQGGDKLKVCGWGDEYDVKGYCMVVVHTWKYLVLTYRRHGVMCVWGGGGGGRMKEVVSR